MLSTNTLVKENKKMTLEDLKRKICETCAHAGVCLIVRAISTLLEEPNFTEQTAPFQVGDLAKICKAYTHISIYTMIKQEDETGKGS